MHGVILAMIAWSASMPEGQKAGGGYEALAAELKAAMDTWERRFGLADDRNAAAAAKEARYTTWPGWAFAPRFVELAEFHPEDPAAFDALSQVVVELGRSVGASDIALAPHYDRAIALLIRDHLDDDRLKEVCRRVAKGLAASSESLLRTAMEKSRNRGVRGAACLSLAENLRVKAEVAEKPWFDDKEQTKDPFARFIAARYDDAYFRYIRGARPPEVWAESRRLLERADKEFGDVVYWQDPSDPGRRRTVGQIAPTLLKNFPAKVGVPAPEIEGDDLDGRQMKLGDFRGKVVVLAFWKCDSPPCRAMVRHARDLVDRLKDGPFVLLGINADDDRHRAARVVESERITWRSWADGMAPGFIAQRWDVKSWPMVTIVDADGVIRFASEKFDEKAGFGAGFDEVLAEALKAAESRKTPR